MRNATQRKISWLGAVLIFALFTIPAVCFSQDLSCSRQIGPEGIAGRTVSVSLKVDLSAADPNGAIVLEALPAGWDIVRASPAYNAYDPATGEYKWLFMGRLDGPKVISYEAAVAGSAPEAGCFDGRVLYTGSDRSRNELEIGGDRCP